MVFTCSVFPPYVFTQVWKISAWCPLTACGQVSPIERSFSTIPQEERGIPTPFSIPCSPFSTLADLSWGFCGFCKSVLSLALLARRARCAALSPLSRSAGTKTADRHMEWWPSGGLNNASALKNVLSPSGTHHTSASSRIASRNATFPSL